MARWRLTAPHYLNVPGTEIEFKETNRDTGKQARKVYPVPRLLNPDDPGDCFQGDCIVAYAGSDQRGDIVFVGEPTPDMEPLDDEAKAITAKWQPQWKHPIESLSSHGGNYSQALVESFEKQMTQLIQNQAPPPNTSIDPKAFEALQAQVAALVAQNTELKAAQPRKA